MPTILAIESSCDETAVAILREHGGSNEPIVSILASEISSQIPLHQIYGGVVPEIASRQHALILQPLIRQALEQADVSLADIDAFAATAGPGLASSLLIGNTTAKALALASGKKYIAVNHLEGHLLSPFVHSHEVPAHVSLIISGGHTMLILVRDAGNYEKLGGTLDDAAGEAFDKVAKMLNLPYPGGPQIEKLARSGRTDAYQFPRALLHESHFDFSFSGLKTSVLYQIAAINDLDAALPNLCASFQQAVVDVLWQKSLRALKQTGIRHLAISGGVSMNQCLREYFTSHAQPHGIQLSLAAPELCTDNAAMIGFAAMLRLRKQLTSSLDSTIDPNLSLFA